MLDIFITSFTKIKALEQRTERYSEKHNDEGGMNKIPVTKKGTRKFLLLNHLN